MITSWTFPAGLCPSLWSSQKAGVTGHISMGGDWEPGLKGGSRTVGQESCWEGFWKPRGVGGGGWGLGGWTGLGKIW